MYREKVKAAKILSLIILIFYLLSIGYISDIFIKTLESKYSPPVEPAGDVIIILGGGATLDTPNINGVGHISGFAANRVLTGAALEKKLQIPIIIAGGRVYSDSGNEAEITKRIFEGLGVDSAKIFIENQSLNTRQNAENVKKILIDNGFKKPILVTSAFHMKRSLYYFEKIGIQAEPYPTDYQANIAKNSGIHNFMPSANALAYNSITLKEYLGLVGAVFLNY